MNQEAWPESDPLVPLGINDPQAINLLLLAAKLRHISAGEYLATLVDCERRGIKPLWRAALNCASSAKDLRRWLPK